MISACEEPSISGMVWRMRGFERENATHCGCCCGLVELVGLGLFVRNIGDGFDTSLRRCEIVGQVGESLQWVGTVITRDGGDVGEAAQDGTDRTVSTWAHSTLVEVTLVSLVTAIRS